MFDCIKFIHSINGSIITLHLNFNAQTKCIIISIKLLFDIPLIVLIIMTTQIILYWMSSVSC